MEDTKLRVVVGDNPEYEDYIAYIESPDSVVQLVAVISQEDGYDNLKISMPIDIPVDANVPYKQFPTFNLKDFEEAINQAKKRLWETRRIDNTSEDE